MKHIKEIEVANYNGYYYETQAPRKDRLTNIRIDIE